MKRDFFERLTDASDSPLAPATPDEAEILNELAPAVNWLRQSAPENGINLAPWWENRLATEPATPMPSNAASRFRGVWREGCRLAAALLLGVGLGAFAWPSGHGNRPETPAVGALCAYNASQRDVMFSLLSQPTTLTPINEPTANAELASCLACHEGALRSRGRGRAAAQ